MSRLDYITMAIVAACILAIIFLVYKMTDLFDGGKNKTSTEIRADSVEVDDDEVYDYEIDENIDSTGSAASDKTQATQQAPAPKATEEMDAASSPAEDDPSPANKTSTISPSASTTAAGSKYLVIAGTFTKRALADKALKNVQQKGFENASLEIFDKGAYAVVLVDRFDDVSDARALVKQLAAKGVKSYVKAQEGE